MRPNGVFKKENSYQKILTPEFYEKCPKAVLAAIAVSFVINHQDSRADMAEEIIMHEWDILHKNGTIPQKPYREVKSAEDLFD